MLRVRDMSLVEFRNSVLNHADVSERVSTQLLETVAASRNGEETDRSLIRGTLTMLVQLGVGSMSVYESVFEERFLAESESFLKTESADFLAANTCSDYLRKAEARIVEERTRVWEYLTDLTGQRLRAVVERCLIAEHTNTLVDMRSGAIAMMDEGKLEELATMYRLFSMVRATVTFDMPVRVAGRETGATVTRSCTPLTVLRERFQRHIESRGVTLVSDTEEAKNPVKFVETLLDMRSKFAAIVETCFFGDKEFLRAMKEAFEFFVNMDGRCAQFLCLVSYRRPSALPCQSCRLAAQVTSLSLPPIFPPRVISRPAYRALPQFLDAEFRQGFKTKAPEEIDETLSAVVTAFRFIKDKDVFESHYKLLLQRRLLSNRSVSDDAERTMIIKLKAECGPQFTSKLEGMFADLTSSRKQMLEFRKGSSRSVAVDATILTTVHWPSLSEEACRLPASVQPVADTFRDWYLAKHTGRRLEWATSQGTAEVSMLCAARRYELVVSTFQMCLLELFNAAETLTFERIRTDTGISVPELKRHLISLCTPAARVLIKGKKGKTITDDEEFTVNLKFKSAKIRNRIKLVTLRSALGAGAAESGGVPEQVVMARKNQMDAAIVRIMKARKTLMHAELVNETIRILCHRFTPKPADVKARVEHLIDRDYIARSADDRRRYDYVA
ncbi:CUL3A [Symbiodinium sp. KB8]|nr:CUL3A [Symbiodinium sp. KB8]